MKILITIGLGIKNLLITIAKWIKSIIESISEKPAIIGLILLIFFGSFVIGSVYLRGKNYKGVFLDNVLVEAHGLLFDIFVFGILIVIFNKISERKREIKRYQEEIDDYRLWESKEATFRIVGNVKRLNRIGITKIDVNNSYLANAQFIESQLKGADFHGANLQSSNFWKADLRDSNFSLTILNNAHLREANLQGADLWCAKLHKAKLMFANLQKAKLKDAELFGAEIWKANLEGAVLTDANFQGANIKDVNFQNALLIGAKNLTIE